MALESVAAAETRSIIPLLQEIQLRQGYIAPSELARAAKEAGISLSRAYGVATFYNHFRLQPPGRCNLKVCTGTACHVKGSGELLEQLQSSLGIKPGQTTPDGEYSLEAVACLGACSRAPVVVLDGETHGRMSRPLLNRLLRGHKRVKVRR